ncbi:hypothetical protein ACJX0J_041691, partial [Zea mays]
YMKIFSPNTVVFYWLRAGALLSFSEAATTHITILDKIIFAAFTNMFLGKDPVQKIAVLSPMYIMYIEVDVPFAHKLGSTHSSQFDFLIQIQQYPVKKEIWKLYHNKYGDLSCCLRSLSSKSISKIAIGTIRNLSNRVLSEDVVNVVASAVVDLGKKN